MFAAIPFFGFADAGAAVVVPLAGGFAADYYVAGSAQAGFTFKADGSVDAYESITGTRFDVQKWYAPVQGGVGSGYWIRATVTSGGAPSAGTVGSWLQLSAAREWRNTATPNNLKDTTLLVEISTSASSAGLVTSGTYRILADADLR